MNRRSRILITAAFFSLLTGCGQQLGPKLAVSSEPSCGFFQSTSGYRISWAERTPVKLFVSKNWPRASYAAVQKAAEIWNEAQSRTYMTVAFESSVVGTSPAPDGLNALYWMGTWSSSRSTEQGVTTLRYNVDHATEADIRINAKDFSYYDEESAAPDAIHLPSLLVHEFGHFLGLTHSQAVRSVMYPFLPSKTVREDLYSLELEALSCEYGGGG